MKLTSLKMTKKEATKMDGPVEVGGDYPRDEYPWGTRISLENESLEKLGIKVENFKVGQEVKVSCEAEVIVTSSRSRIGGKDQDSLELQITALAIEGVEKGKMARVKDAESYPGDVANV